jgi:tetratricopeptide (TPR) repeat protein
VEVETDVLCMLKQFNRFLFLAIIVAAALYITLTNSDSATLRLGPNLTVTTYAGVIYIGIFALGCVAASLVALFFGLKSYLRERRLLSFERGRQSFLKAQENARGLMSAGDWSAARGLWEEVIGQDPENVVARVELSRCVEELGDLREALRVLDTTRANSHSNAEVLFRAAHLNQRLGNNTAARDNLGLIIATKPSRRAFELARDTSEALGKFDEALAYQQELEKLGHDSESSSAVWARLRHRQIMSDLSSSESTQTELATLVKRHPEYAPALDSLAELARARGDLDLCAEYLVKAARAAHGDVTKWRTVVELWLNAAHVDQRQRADRAIAAARSATKDSRGSARLEAELLLIETLLAVNHFQDAERAIEGFPALALKEGLRDTDAFTQRLAIQKGYCLAQTGNLHSTGPLWKQLAIPRETSTSSQTSGSLSVAGRAEPSPALSTP